MYLAMHLKQKYNILLSVTSNSSAKQTENKAGVWNKKKKKQLWQVDHDTHCIWVKLNHFTPKMHNRLFFPKLSNFSMVFTQVTKAYVTQVTMQAWFKSLYGVKNKSKFRQQFFLKNPQKIYLTLKKLTRCVLLCFQCFSVLPNVVLSGLSLSS